MIIVLIGLPGTGKGTQSKYIEQEFSYSSLSTGNMLREMAKEPGLIGDFLRNLPTGSFAPDDIVIKAVKENLQKPAFQHGVVLDGFPRTLAQAAALDQFLDSKGQSVTATVALDADDSVLVARLLERGKTSGRPDDQDEEKIRNRYQEYNEKTAPLMDYYKGQGKFHAVDGIGAIDEVTARLSNVIDNL